MLSQAPSRQGKSLLLVVGSGKPHPKEIGEQEGALLSACTEMQKK